MTRYTEFYDHEVVQKTPDDYTEMTIAPQKLLDAWSSSLFAHELLKNGAVKSSNDMKNDTLEKFIDADEKFKRNEPLPKPVIGIGIMDGIEIGIGREIIAAARVNDVDVINVCVRNAQLKDVNKLLGV